jgi:hypothetical protein
MTVKDVMRPLRKLIRRIRDAKGKPKITPGAMDALHRSERMLMTAIGDVPSTYSGRVKRRPTVRQRLRPAKARRQAAKKGPQGTAS